MKVHQGRNVAGQTVKNPPHQCEAIQTVKNTTHVLHPSGQKGKLLTQPEQKTMTIHSSPPTGESTSQPASSSDDSSLDEEEVVRAAWYQGKTFPHSNNNQNNALEKDNDKITEDNQDTTLLNENNQAPATAKDKKQ